MRVPTLKSFARIGLLAGGMAAAGGGTTLGSEIVLRLHDRGPAVAVLQRALGVTADGDFGPITLHAVKAFQARHGLLVDGQVGPHTRAALHLAAGKELTAGTVSSQVAALMKGARNAMSLTQLKLTLTLVLGLGLLGAGAGMAAYEALTNEPTPFRRELQAGTRDDQPTPPAKQARVDLYGDPLPEVT